MHKKVLFDKTFFISRMPINSPINICVRLPNWLGDVVMSFGFLHVLRQTYPDAIITVVIKKGLEQVVEEVSEINSVIVFSKDDYRGLRGVWKFGKRLRASASYNLFFVLPDSFSAAVMAYASGAKLRVGYRNEGRNFLLTHAYKKEINLHRVEEYAGLLYRFNLSSQAIQPVLEIRGNKAKEAGEYIVVNINSEAVSRRLPIVKAVELITLLQQYSLPIKLIGSPNEKFFVTEVFNALNNKIGVEITAGKTNLKELMSLIQEATVMVSSDSGPAHIAGAFKTPLVVLFGAGNEANTGPFKNTNALVVRNGKLPCEPCVKNTCQLASLPVCLTDLDMQKVILSVNKLMLYNA